MPRRFLSITELVGVVQGVLEAELPEIAFEGEVSQITKAASGHIYLTLKDEKSQIPVVIWRGLAQTIKFDLKAGVSIRCSGRPNLYNVSGKFQFVLTYLELAGEGALQKKFLELKAKLEKEGLFAPERKRPIPFFPKAVGVVTSKTGAVIHDIMVKIQGRMPAMPVFLVDARVQGEGAAEEIAAGVQQLDASGLVDVIIVARGGGSLEDLWAFNEEVVVRAIFASKTPIVSGVGHEVDVTLTDFVADVRAPTPTAAAEMVVPKRDDLLALISDYERRLLDSDRWFRPKEQRLDELAIRLDKRITAALQLAGVRLENSSIKLDAAAVRNLDRAKARFGVLNGRFVALNPREVMKRGYCVARGKHGPILASDEVRPQDELTLMFARGGAEVSVIEVIDG